MEDLSDILDVRTDAKLKRLPWEVQEQIWRFRNPQDGEDPMTFTDILAWLLKEHACKSSAGAMSNYYPWLKMRMRMLAAQERANQAREEMARDPNATPESIARVGQMVFTSEMVEDRNVKAFVELERLRLQHRLADQDERKLKLLEERSADAKAKLEAITSAAKSQGGLSPETLKQIEEAAGLL